MIIFQDNTLHELQARNKEAKFILINGFQLEGAVQCFDDDVVVVYAGGQLQMIYKHAISTIATGVRGVVKNNMKISMHTIQSRVLCDLIAQSNNVKIFFVNGFQLDGLVKCFDNDVIIVRVSGNMEMIYKHAVSTIALGEHYALPTFIDKEKDVADYGDNS